MEILSLANTELDEKIEQELIDNPVLEKQTEGPEVDQNQPKEKERTTPTTRMISSVCWR